VFECVCALPAGSSLRASFKDQTRDLCGRDPFLESPQQTTKRIAVTAVLHLNHEIPSFDPTGHVRPPRGR
jgi:hypothetical protein